MRTPLRAFPASVCFLPLSVSAQAQTSIDHLILPLFHSVRSSRKHIQLLVFALFFFAIPSQLRAQGPMDVGTPPFATMAGSPYDTINLATGAITFNIPLRSKSGPYSYSMSLEGVNALDILPDGQWQPTGNYSTVGWLGFVPGGTFGFAATSYSSGKNPCNGLGTSSGTYYYFYNVLVIDSKGTRHPTNAPQFYVDCSGNTKNPPIGSAFSTTDNTGWTIVVTGYDQLGTPLFDVYDRSGVLNSWKSPNGLQLWSTSESDTSTSQSTTYSDVYLQNVITTTRNFTASPQAFVVTGGSASYTDSAGHLQQSTLNFSPVTAQTNFQCPQGYLTDYPPTSASLPTSFTLPNGRAFTFTYEPTPGNPSSTTERLQTIGLPDGGSITYTYTGGESGTGVYCANAFPVVTGTIATSIVPILTRTINDGNGHQSTWKYQIPNYRANGGGGNHQTIVTDPENNDTVYIFSEGFQTAAYSYQGPASNGNLLKTTITCYNGNFTDCPNSGLYTYVPTPAQQYTVFQTDVYTSFNNGSPSLVETLFNSAGLPYDVKQYDFGAAYPPTGTPKTETTTTYGSWNGSACVALPNHIQDRICSQTVQDGSTIISDERNTYDNNGNKIATSRLISGSSRVSEGHTYFPNGSLHTDTDGNGTLTTYANADCNGLMPTSVSRGGISVQQTWDCNGAVVTSTIGPNPGQTTNYTYEDPFYRLTGVHFPDGGSSTTCYTDVGGPLCAQSSTANKTYNSVAAAPDPARLTITTKDGIGRTISVSAPDGSKVDTTYDVNGFVASTSNPYLQTADKTYGVTSYLYDALGRKTYQCNQDNAPAGASVCLPSNSFQQWNYTGESSDLNVEFYDETRRHWTRKYDSLQHLTKVFEPDANNSPSLETDYQFDSTGNVRQIDQWGGASGSSGDRQRTFTYDGLSRLTNTVNPESGTTSYTYDGNNNLLLKQGGTETTAYCYDNQNRVVSRSATNQACPMASPDVVYTYDSSSIPGATNTIGQLTQESTLSGTNIVTSRMPYAYDLMGRVRSIQECVLASCANGASEIDYSYNLAGDVKSYTNGLASSPIQYGQTYDGMGNLISLTSSVSDAANRPDTLFRASPSGPFGVAYGPGGLENGVIGVNSKSGTILANITESYDNRLRPVSKTVSPYNTGNSTTSSGSITISGADQQVMKPATHATGSFSITGYDHDHLVCTQKPNPDGFPITFCSEVYDTGTITVTIGSYTASADYDAGSNDETIASDLAASLSLSGSPVTATSMQNSVSSNVVTMTSAVPGSDGNIAYNVSDGFDFQASDPSGSLSGGNDAQLGADTGTITVTVNGATASAPWSAQNTDGSQLATTLASGLATAGVSFLTASAANGVITLHSIPAGANTNWPISVQITDDNPPIPPSFSATETGMSGGAGTGTSAYYSYAISTGTGYDVNGNLLEVADSVAGTWTYGYDRLNRLQSATAASGTYSGMNISGANLAWNYDAFGNRLGQSSNTGLLPALTEEYPAADNHLATLNAGAKTLQYDANGNITWDGTNSYAYDSEGRMCASSSGSDGYIQNVYDAEGNRVATGTITSLSCDLSSNGFSLTNSYIVGLKGEQLTVLDGSGQWLRSNAFMGGTLLATYAGSETYFALEDWEGTKRVQLTPDGTVSTSASLPFGDDLSTSGFDAATQHFTGKEHDSTTGLDFFGARFYSSQLGRWTSPDPSMLDYADLSNPQSFNFYNYVLNNPLINIDLTGLECTGTEATEDQVTGNDASSVATAPACEANTEANKAVGESQVTIVHANDTVTYGPSSVNVSGVGPSTNTALLQSGSGKVAGVPVPKPPNVTNVCTPVFCPANDTPAPKPPDPKEAACKAAAAAAEAKFAKDPKTYTAGAGASRVLSTLQSSQLPGGSALTLIKWLGAAEGLYMTLKANSALNRAMYDSAYRDCMNK